MTAQLANGGHKIHPRITLDKDQDTFENIKYKMRLADEKTNNNEKSIIKVTEELLGIGEKKYDVLYRNQENIKFVLNAMFRSTNEVYGTSFASRIEDPKYQFAGKTGTSQVKRITERERELDLDISQIP